jgi:hypothetical protein
VVKDVKKIERTFVGARMRRVVKFLGWRKWIYSKWPSGGQNFVKFPSWRKWI